MSKNITKTDGWYVRDRAAEKLAPIMLPVNKLVAPNVGVFDAPTRCYQVNIEWAKIIIGMASLLTEIGLWQDAWDESFPAIQEVMKFLQGADCMDCTDVVNCIEADGNYQAMSELLFQQMIAAGETFIAELEAAYDGTPQSIGADIPVGVPDATESDALCYSLAAFVGTYAASKRAEISTVNNLQVAWDEVKSRLYTLYNKATSLIAPIPTPDIGSCFVDYNEALTVLADNAALDEFACCLHDELDGVTMSETAFNTAIGNCVSSLTGNAQLVACIFDNDNDQTVYLVFLSGYQVALERQDAGDSLPCTCGNVFGWEYATDGCPLVPPPGWTFSYVGDDCGELVCDYGYYSAQLNSENTTQQVVITINFGQQLNVTSIVTDTYRNDTSGTGSVRVQCGAFDETRSQSAGAGCAADNNTWNVNGLASSLIITVTATQTFSIAACRKVVVNWT